MFKKIKALPHYLTPNALAGAMATGGGAFAFYAYPLPGLIYLKGM